jgi:putative phage-type endonuclease
MHPKVAELLAQKYDDQRSPEWFALRGQMLTASDVASAVGSNFFKHPETLILEKCGLGRKFTGNADTARGTRLEPYVRDMYDAQNGSKSHEIGLLVHPVYKWLGGSPDGVTEDGVLIEIKCPKKISKKVPEYYMPQIQILLEIMELEECDFIQYSEEKDLMQVIRVHRDREWFSEKLPIMDTFWKRVLYKREHGVCELLTWTPSQPLSSKEDPSSLHSENSPRDAHESRDDS